MCLGKEKEPEKEHRKPQNRERCIEMNIHEKMNIERNGNLWSVSSSGQEKGFLKKL